MMAIIGMFFQVDKAMQRSHRMLILTLRSMSLTSLLAAVQRGLMQHCHQVKEAVDALLLHLRRLACRADNFSAASMSTSGSAYVISDS